MVPKDEKGRNKMVGKEKAKGLTSQNTERILCMAIENM